MNSRIGMFPGIKFDYTSFGDNEIPDDYKNALYLVNRKSLYEQIKAKIIEYPHVKIMTYQALQALIRKNIEIPHYDYIIADECHHGPPGV